MTLRIVYDQSSLVETALGGVGRAVLIGAGLVVVVLFVLLGNWRAALLVTLTLPLSIALSGLLLRAGGIGINTMTLGGLAIAVGLLVDAAIIVTENVVHHLQRRPDAPRTEIALHAAMEVGRPIVFATLIVVAVFVPLFAMTGIEGRMYRPLAAAVVAALAASLLLALTLVPVAAGDAPPAAPARRRGRRLARSAQVKRALCARRSTARCATPGWCASRRWPSPSRRLRSRSLVGSDFMPQLDEGAFLLQTVLPPDTSLEEVDRVNHRVEDVLRALRRGRRRGAADRPRRAHRGPDAAHRSRTCWWCSSRTATAASRSSKREMREALENVPGVSVLFTTPLGMRIDEGLGGTPADLSVRIFGPDLDQLARLGAEAGRSWRTIEGLEDLRVEAVTGLPQLRIAIDRDAVARAGLTPGRRRSRAAHRPGRRRGVRGLGRPAALRPRRPPGRSRAEQRGGHPRPPPRRPRRDPRPAQQLARVEEVFAPGHHPPRGRQPPHRRRRRRSRAAISAAPPRRCASGSPRNCACPTGYFVDVGGRVEQQERAAQSLTVAMAAALLAVFVLLYLALGSFAETPVILATLPDAFVGGILALLIAGETWNVSSLVGLIGLFGIAVQNGLVLVAQTRGLVAEGRPFGRRCAKPASAACARS